MSIFSENIRRIRTDRHMEQKDLAEKLNISNKTISSWECGRTEPRMGMVEKLCEALRCTKSDLMADYELVLENENYENFEVHVEAMHDLPRDALLRVFAYIDYEKSRATEDQNSDLRKK